VQFQELILAAKLVFIAGIAEAKSKGRGEECISQNLRIFRGYNGKQVMLFFANSQRKELKRYVSIPGMGPLQSSLAALYPIYATILTLCEVNCIETVNPGKKAGRPVVLDLQPNFDLLSQMKTLHIQFLDDQGMSLRPRDWETRLTRCRSESILRISDQSDVITVPYADTVSEQRISGTLLLGSTTRNRHRHRHGDSGLPIQGIAKAVHAVIGY
jgi:hypothetical protein